MVINSDRNYLIDNEYRLDRFGESQNNTQQHPIDVAIDLDYHADKFEEIQEGIGIIDKRE